ncbi:MAG TPA: glutaredoxin [Pseudomonadota bacterium]|nr:glutaredoxin [Pseudomonadota bacterium]
MPERISVYTRPRCLFCHQVIDLLQQAQIAFVTIELTERAQQDEIAARHRATSFPIVLVEGRYIGGYAQILHLHSQGRLAEIAASGTPSPATAQTPRPPGEPSPSSHSPVSAALPSQRSRPSLTGTMSRLHQALSEPDPKKR